MIADRLARVFPVGSPLLRVVVGSIAIAMAVSLGTLWGARLAGADIGAAIPAVLGAMAAAAFAVRAGRPSGDRR